MNEKIVLIFEDDDPSHILLTEYLSIFGLKSIRSSSGTNAIEICKTNFNIFLVLLDIKLPDMYGIDVCRHIKKNRPDLNIVFQSALVKPMIKEQCLAAGGIAYLSKPVSYNILQSYLNDLGILGINY